MSEIRRDPIIVIVPGMKAIEGFDEDHSLFDIVRWLMRNTSEAEDVRDMLSQELERLEEDPGDMGDEGDDDAVIH